MRTIVVTPPAGPLIPWDQVQAHLNLDGADDEDVAMAMLAAAAAHLDGPAGWLGRALGQQTLEARFDGFDASGVLQLPYPPLVEVLSLTYLDGTGTATVIPTDAYETFGSIVEPAFGTAWPSTRWGRETVRVQYIAGYPDGIPAPIRAALLLMVADLFANRETVVDSKAAVSVPMSTTVEALLAPCRVWA